MAKPSRVLKREATALLIKTQNKFAVLANISETDGTIASTSAATPAHEQQPIPLVTMETSDSAKVTVTERTATKKEPRPPSHSIRS